MIPTVIAKCIVTNPEGKVLILRREPNDSNRPGEADFPGGGVDAGESPTETVVRELQEEAGVDVEAKELTLIYGVTDEENNKIAITYLLKNYLGEISLSPEHDAYWWKSPDEASQALDGIRWQAGLEFAIKNGLI